jgi:hypothetical protein
MTPKEFVQKWKKVEQKERSVAQQHFLDLCELLGHGKPADLDPKGEWFTFEYGVEKRDGKDGFADVWKKGFFAWEYKGKHKDLDEAWKQLDTYRASLENPPLLVVCDTDRFEIHTSFTNSPHVVHVVKLEDLLQPEKLEYLHSVFFEPDKLRPGRISKVITADAAKAFGELALSLRKRGVEPRRVARFLDRMIFCLFAEDVGILPNEIASKLLEQSRGKAELFTVLSADLFAKMAKGGYFGVDRIPYFNGHLFDDSDSLALTTEELELLWQGARLDWSAIDPAIFGTLFERGLDPDKRSQLGAHYTSKEDIETLVEPVVMTPLRREWEETKAQVDRLLQPAKRLTPRQEKKARLEGWIFLERFLRRLESVTVLDPACGSGNFLYVTLRKLKDLEAEAYDFILDRGFQAPAPRRRGSLAALWHRDQPVRPRAGADDGMDRLPPMVAAARHHGLEGTHPPGDEQYRVQGRHPRSQRRGKSQGTRVAAGRVHSGESAVSGR